MRLKYIHSLSHNSKASALIAKAKSNGSRMVVRVKTLSIHVSYIKSILLVLSFILSLYFLGDMENKSNRNEHVK